MRILFLDDCKHRHSAFVQNTIGVLSDRVFNAEDALGLLQTVKYDLIFLDHDLDETDKSATDGTLLTRSMAVDAKVLELNGDADVVIHSLNPPGSKVMEQNLQKVWRGTVTRIPFAWRSIQVNTSESGAKTIVVHPTSYWSSEDCGSGLILTDSENTKDNDL